MWIFTRHGFFSIVEHKANPGLLMVRARIREDLEDAFGEADIIETADSGDYRFRKSMPRQVVADYLGQEAFEIDYTSVKDEIDKDEPRRHRMLYDVWDAHARWQRDVYDEHDWVDLVWNKPGVRG